MYSFLDTDFMSFEMLYDFRQKREKTWNNKKKRGKL